MPPTGWVLYDDSCGFCRQWVPYWRETLGKRGFSIAALQSAWVQERLNASADELLDEAAPDPSLRRGVISMTHAFGQNPADEPDPVRFGVNTNQLLSISAEFDGITGMPRM